LVGITGTSARRRRRRIGAALIAGVLVAAACSDRKDDSEGVSGADTAPPSGPSTTEAPATTTASTGGTTGSTTGGTEPPGTTAPTTTQPPETTEPAIEPVMGGTLVVSGEAEVANPWSPVTMQCDSYCQQRARTFFDPLAAYGEDLKVHPFLAESIEPNADFTEWTIKLRDGISFHDGTPLNADAAIYNLQRVGTGLLVAAALTDVAKVPSQADPSVMELKIEKVDDMTFTIFTGKGGDPNKPVPWRDFDAYLTAQWGFMASPKWLKAIDTNPEVAAHPVGTGPFIFESYAPRDKLVVNKNPDYWMKDSEGRQLPYLDRIEFRVIEDSETAAEALQSGEIDIFATSSGRVINDFQQMGDEYSISLQDKLTETNFILIDQSKKNALADRRVRCALSMAIDRQELIDATDGGVTQPANGLFSPGQQGYLEDNGLVMEQDLEGAAALIEEYESETGQQAVVNYGHTPTRANDDEAELLLGWWDEIGVDAHDTPVPQDQFITLALFGDPIFEAFGWRQHAGVGVDQQYYWWHSAGSHPDGELSLNFGRLNDPVIDDALDAARSATSDEEATAAAETVNRQFAKNCYYIPTSWTLWGIISDPGVQGLGTFVMPDGTPARDGAGFSGSYWVNTMFVEE
jgi:peptide/nickel transport system substrate-binding protein